MDARTGDVIDLGPHILVSEYGNMLALLRMLGTQDRIAWQADRLIRLVEQDGRVTDMHQHALPPPLHLLPSMAKVRSVGLRDKWSNRKMVGLAMRVDERVVAELDDMSALELLQRSGVSERFIDWFWASVCMAVMNLPLDLCSAGALLRIAARLLGRQGYRIGLPTCGLAELFAPQAGKIIAAELGRIRLHTRAMSLSMDSGRVAGVRLADDSMIPARHVVLAIPPHELHALLSRTGILTRHTQLLQSFEPCPYISAYLWFDRKVTTQSFWSQVWNPAGLVTDFYDLSNFRRAGTSGGSLLASNIIFSHRAHGLEDEEIIRRVVNEAARAAPTIGQAHLEHAVVSRIPMAIACPLPGMEKLRLEPSIGIDGLLIAGDWTRTCLPSCMESAVHSGFTAAEILWTSIGRPRRLVIPLPPVQGLSRVARILPGDPLAPFAGQSSRLERP
jgi:15-cis-phytoene desaturase